jgi:DNA (cytosine-5)-methyltransferase 1
MIKFIDLFCGLGGFRVALESYGLQCVFSSDIDKHVQKNYKYNFNEDVRGDITAIHEQDIPAHDVLCAGFPCQPFSIANSTGKAGFQHTKGTLFYDVIRIAQYHKPKIVFLENVARILKHDDGKTLEIITQTLQNVGYDTHYKILNSADYNTAQQRKRFYLVAIRKDVQQNFVFPAPNKKYRVLESCIDHRYNTDQSLIIKREYSLKDDIDKPVKKPVRLGLIGGRDSQGQRIYSVKGTSITFTASGGGVAGKTGAYLISNIVRKLHIQECLNILGFDSKYKFHSEISKAQQYKMIGNSVCVDVLKKITGNFIHLL